MNDKAAKAKANGAQTSGDETGVDAIREVLLGDRLRMYEQRFDLLDRTVQSEREALRETFEQKLDQVHSSLGARIEQVAKDLAAEKQSRIEDVKSVVTKLENASGQLREQIDGVSGKLQAHKQDTDREMLALSKKLFKELQDACANLNDFIDRESTRLSAVKVDRNEMAGALNHMAEVISSGSPDATGSADGGDA